MIHGSKVDGRLFANGRGRIFSTNIGNFRALGGSISRNGGRVDVELSAFKMEFCSREVTHERAVVCGHQDGDAVFVKTLQSWIILKEAWASRSPVGSSAIKI